MATYVLVHGMWHGGWCWSRTTPLLLNAGHQVFTPTLTGLGERAQSAGEDIDWATHVLDIMNVLEEKNLHAVRLVGHSYAGGLVLEVAHRLPERIERIICLDALTPADGRSYREQFPNFYDPLRRQAEAAGNPEWVAPPADWNFGVTDEADLAWLKSRLIAHPLRTLESPVSFHHPAALALPRTWISCTKGKSEEAIASEEKKWTSRGWQYHRLYTGHDAMITDPAGVAALLMEA